MDDKKQADNSEEQVHTSLYDSIKHYGIMAFLWFAPSYYLLHPEDLAVLIVDYLKFHPDVVAQMIEYASPAVAGVLNGFVLIRIALVAFLLLFLLVCLFMLVIALLSWIVTWVTFGHIRNFLWFNFRKLSILTEKIPDITKYEKNIDKFQAGLASITAATLYFMTLNGHTRWDAQSNPKILIAAQKHYFCQVTSGYNQNRCQEVINK